MTNKHRTDMITHAGRSLLQEAARFSNEGKAVGEYVKNSWQCTDHDPTDLQRLHEFDGDEQLLVGVRGEIHPRKVALLSFEAMPERMI